eukprot:gene11378-biopygen12409
MLGGGDAQILTWPCLTKSLRRILRNDATHRRKCPCHRAEDHRGSSPPDGSAGQHSAAQRSAAQRRAAPPPPPPHRCAAQHRVAPRRPRNAAAMMTSCCRQLLPCSAVALSHALPRLSPG